ncbi:hypothetical protein SUGI_0467310 [Cryptomeria japonica]|nr:hypothetical protein SUGI_0467310 [Cryptomeria japonica]
MKGVIEPHRHEGIFIAKAKEEAIAYGAAVQAVSLNIEEMTPEGSPPIQKKRRVGDLTEGNSKLFSECVRQRNDMTMSMVVPPSGESATPETVSGDVIIDKVASSLRDPAVEVKGEIMLAIWMQTQGDKSPRLPHWTRQEILVLIMGNKEDKEIFMRELISNTSDAIDTICFEKLTDKSKLDSPPELFIHIVLDKDLNEERSYLAQSFEDNVLYIMESISSSKIETALWSMEWGIAENFCSDLMKIAKAMFSDAYNGFSQPDKCLRRQHGYF